MSVHKLIFFLSSFTVTLSHITQLVLSHNKLTSKYFTSYFIAAAEQYLKAAATSLFFIE